MSGVRVSLPISVLVTVLGLVLLVLLTAYLDWRLSWTRPLVSALAVIFNALTVFLLMAFFLVGEAVSTGFCEMVDSRLQCTGMVPAHIRFFSWIALGVLAAAVPVAIAVADRIRRRNAELEASNFRSVIDTPSNPIDELFDE